MYERDILDNRFRCGYASGFGQDNIACIHQERYLVGITDRLYAFLTFEVALYGMQVALVASANADDAVVLADTLDELLHQ